MQSSEHVRKRWATCLEIVSTRTLKQRSVSLQIPIQGRLVRGPPRKAPSTRHPALKNAISRCPGLRCRGLELPKTLTRCLLSSLKNLPRTLQSRVLLHDPMVCTQYHCAQKNIAGQRKTKRGARLSGLIRANRFARFARIGHSRESEI